MELFEIHDKVPFCFVIAAQMPTNVPPQHVHPPERTRRRARFLCPTLFGGQRFLVKQDFTSLNHRLPNDTKNR